MHNLLRTVLLPIRRLRHCYDNYLKKHNPEKLYKLYFKRETGINLNTLNPQTLDEIVAYNAFHTNTTMWTVLADKVGVREYVASKTLKHILPKLYGVWSSSEDIDFESLPNSFVIKTNNASATNIIVQDKSKEDIELIRKQLREWLMVDYGYDTAQPHYSKITPMILAEELLVDEKSTMQNKPLMDFKFYCINGTPLFVIVYTDRVANSHNMKRTMYDMEWIQHPEFLGDSAVHGPEIEKPVSLDAMISYAKILSAGFKFVRVDFYEINNKPIFGEMTFTPGVHETSYEFSKQIGTLINNQ